MIEEIFGKGKMKCMEVQIEKIIEEGINLFGFIELIGENIGLYQDYYKENKVRELILCKISYKKCIKEAKNQGLDTSKYPEELNYLDLLN